MTVMRPGDCYIGGTPGTTVTGAGYTTVIDASLRNQTARAGDGDDAVIGGPNDTIMVGNGHIPSTNFGANLAIKCEYSNYFRNDIDRQWRCAAQPQFGQLNLFAKWQRYADGRLRDLE